MTGRAVEIGAVSLLQPQRCAIFEEELERRNAIAAGSSASNGFVLESDTPRPPPVVVPRGAYLAAA